ncbi:uncharacterized protein FTJAE_5791 [Fusarium tjaetaba]|uniref:Transmembrane protein n=1 Tax=Fusarium tjaetaba TaxID=1567544 RepID=A0A8H5RM79_9HYPO|nr:uncharacterized protein FTJAE_5791 [Fusarium tjaetaba]KAF5637376.1 hypothetical protein FTJAE_5791 [Fusarium tjaetaba]
MSGHSPTHSSSPYETAPTSPPGTLYNAENGMRFIAHGMRNTTTGEIVIFDSRNVQQWELDVATNQLWASLHAATSELFGQITQIHEDMNGILRLRKEDLKRARRRNQTLLFCVLGVLGFLNGIFLVWVLKHRG